MTPLRAIISKYILATLILGFGATAAFASFKSFRIIETNSQLENDILKAIQDAPVHDNIITTVFWIGERAKPNSGWSSNLDSAWDGRWKENYGGLDSPKYRKGYFPAKFVPKQNPFYIALPFNDISNPDYIDSCPLLKFFRMQKAPRSKSICKNRWIEINYQGKRCYAQWQDVGPIYTNDYDYVFLSNEPRAHKRHMAGLDISPAVRDFLRLDSTTKTSWRFVDEQQVPDGPWKTIVTRS